MTSQDQGADAPATPPADLEALMRRCSPADNSLVFMSSGEVRSLCEENKRLRASSGLTAIGELEEAALRLDVAGDNEAATEARHAIERVRGAARASSVSPASDGVLPYPKSGDYFYVHTREVWRWLPYKPDGARQMKKLGRWQRYKEYGFENAELAEGLKWELIPDNNADTKGRADV